MGNYYFTPHDGSDVVKVEYSFGYKLNNDGELRIILHGSHLPYQVRSTRRYGDLEEKVHRLLRTV